MLYGCYTDKDFHLYLDTAYNRKVVILISEVNENKAFICDILMNEEDCSKGYGTLVMKYFLEQIKKKRITSIFGEISNVDSKQFFRQEEYYKKFGFTVERDEKTKLIQIFQEVKY